jgi:hypothetical protein
MNMRKVTLPIAIILARYDKGMRRNHIASSMHSTRTTKYNNFDVLLSPPHIRRPKAHHHLESSNLLEGGSDDNVFQLMKVLLNLQFVVLITFTCKGT